jgi:hypothetical protein
MSGKVFGRLQKTLPVGHNLISIKMDRGHHIPPIEVHCTFFMEILEWQSVHIPRPNTLEDLKLALQQEIWKFTTNIYRNVINNLKRRDHVIKQKWRHVQNVQ